MPLWEYLEKGGKRAVAVWHRRAGKDSCALNWTATEIFQKPGVYWHMLPTQRQARKAIWNGVDREGRRIIDQVFPKPLVKHRNSTEMYIETFNGSFWQLCGSDNYDSLVGSNPRGVVFSEWPLTNPAAWDFIRPILAENDGWALFIYTPRGRNHGYRLLKAAEKQETWFSQVLTVVDTKRPDGSSVVSQEAIEEDRASGMAEELLEQEYMCSFDAALVGSYYGKLLTQARKDGRICFVPARPDVEVHTAWDIGIGDATVIWWFQQIGNEIGIIDCYHNVGVGIDHYARVVRERQEQRGYVYGKHYGPHDVGNHEWGSGRTREEQASRLGIKFTIVPRTSVEDGINAVRAILPRCRFDEEKCERGLDALTLYQREWDEEKQMFKERPLHDWTSDYADAFRYLALAVKDQYFKPAPRFDTGMTFDEHFNRHIGGKREERIGF